MTMALPLIEWGLPITARLSWMSTTVLPELPVFMFPRSPMCLFCIRENVNQVVYLFPGYPRVWSSVCAVEGIEMSPRSLAAVSEVSKLMNMKPVDPRCQTVNKSWETRFYALFYWIQFIFTNIPLTECSLVWTVSLFDLWHCPRNSSFIFCILCALFSLTFPEWSKLQTAEFAWHLAHIAAKIRNNFPLKAIPWDLHWDLMTREWFGC